jgi:hypothetical protein
MNHDIYMLWQWQQGLERGMLTLQQP